MHLVELHLETGVLLIGRPHALSRIATDAADRLSTGATVRLLQRDSIAMSRLRAGWQSLCPTPHAVATTSQDLIGQLQRELNAGHLLAAKLADALAYYTPVKVTEETSRVIHLPLPDAVVLVAPRGMIPPELGRVRASAELAAEIGSMPINTPAIQGLKRQAKRLSIGGITKPDMLRQRISIGLQSGTMDAIRLETPVKLAMVAARSDVPKAVFQLDKGDKVAEALERSSHHVSGELRTMVERLVQPENLAIIAGVFIAVALAQLNPVSAAVVDGILVGMAWASAGIAGIKAIGTLVKATLKAMDATSEAELDQAGRLYAEAFVELGSMFIQALFARFLSKSTASKEPALPKAKPRPGPKPKPDAPPAPQGGATPGGAAVGGEVAATAAAFRTKPNEAMFWSGLGPEGAVKAADQAKRLGRKTLEQICEERGIKLPEWDRNNPAVVKAWEDASRMFAQGAKGEVQAVLGNVRAESVWSRIEFEALKANPAVTKITAVDAVTGALKTLWP